jgi:hypothetical protein
MSEWATIAATFTPRATSPSTPTRRNSGSSLGTKYVLFSSFHFLVLFLFPPTHKKKKKKKKMAKYDLPAMWEYITTTTTNPKLFYVGHSEGTTIAFALLTQNQTMADYLYGYVGLGPVITAGHITNYFLKTLADFDVIDIWVLLGDKQFFPTPELLHTVFVDFCADCEICCDDVIEFICGPHKGAFNDSRMPVMAGHEPGGTSVQNTQHWTQMVKHGQFQMFDYGLFGNRQHYGHDHPPRSFLSFPTFPFTSFLFLSLSS